MSEDTISRQAVIEINRSYHGQMPNEVNHRIWKEINELPSAQPETHEERTKTHSCDCISRQAAIEALKEAFNPSITNFVKAKLAIENLPSAQPERTCVNCGRTVNNGGWYADGGTRCPIEEHYALPKDGYCHLWEKRNVTDDDYPERRTDE